jgi:hypothetical protein
MRKLHVGLLVGVLALMGCNRESPPGGPGAKTTPGAAKPVPDDSSKTPPPQAQNRDETFKVKVPSGGTNVTQGKREEVTISLSRGDNFNDTVHLKFSAPAGLKVVPADVSIKRGETKTNVMVEAAEDAPVGRQTITVTGSPESGKSTSVNMDIDIKKKS